MAKTNLSPLSGTQAIVEYLMLHNTDGRNAFYELEHRVDAQGQHAVYLRYGAMLGANREKGGSRSVIALGGSNVCDECIRERVKEKEGRNYHIVTTDLPSKSLHDGTDFVPAKSLEDARKAAVRAAAFAKKEAEVTAELQAPDQKAALAGWVSNALFG